MTPLGFSVSDRWLKRAGLDYWEGVDVQLVENLEAYLETCHSFYFFSSHATKNYTEVPYEEDTHLIFGSETAGLPGHLKEKWPERFVTLPMLPTKRCLNLATSVGIGVYEAIRQNSLKN